MTTVRFDNLSEFLDELKTEFGDLKAGPVPVIPPILRIACLYRPNPLRHDSRILFIVATVKDTRGDIVRIDIKCGPLFGGKGKQRGYDQETEDEAKKTRYPIEGEAKRLGLEIRAGILEGGSYEES